LRFLQRPFLGPLFTTPLGQRFLRLEDRFFDPRFGPGLRLQPPLFFRPYRQVAMSFFSW
jgi:hypothetical protein